MNTAKILIVGANGQLGSVLTETLQKKYGIEQVIASDLYHKPDFKGYFEVLDGTDFNQLHQIVVNHKITEIYHLAAILSANGEKDPIRTWDINIKALLNVLEVGRIEKVDKIFYPSSIAVFGNSAPRRKASKSALLITWRV